MGYVTISEGFRIGAIERHPRVHAGGPRERTQALCALPDEVQYFPDTTTNYELGIRSQWLDRRLTFNGALYYIDWKDPQLATVPRTAPCRSSRTATAPTARASSSRSTPGSTHADDRGRELLAHLGRALRSRARGAACVRAAGFRSDRDHRRPAGRSTAGLPARPGHGRGSATTCRSSAGRNVDLNYGISAIGDVITTIGERAGGQRLGGYAVHTASAILHGNRWTAGVYGQNLLNKFAITGVRSRQAFVQTVTDSNGDPVHVRSLRRRDAPAARNRPEVHLLARRVTSAMIRGHDR